MKIRVTRPDDPAAQTMTITYPASGLLWPERNSSSSHIDRGECGAGRKRRRDGLGARFVSFCCECLEKMMEMDVASKAPGAGGVSRSHQRTLDRIRDDQSWARLDSEESLSMPTAVSRRGNAKLRSQFVPAK